MLEEDRAADCAKGIGPPQTKAGFIDGIRNGTKSIGGTVWIAAVSAWDFSGEVKLTRSVVRGSAQHGKLN